MLDPSIIKVMVSSGCTVEQLASVVDAHLAIEHEKLLAKRAAGRQRQRRYIEKLKQNQRSYDASLTVTDRHEGGLSYVEEMDVKTIEELPVKEVTLNQHMLNQVTVSRAREADFEVFYQAYPHKVGRPAAAKSFTKAHKKAPLEQILAGLETYIGSKPPDRPWCNPATWLNQERWNDHPAPAQSLAKPLSPRLSVIMNNRRMFSEAAAAETTELRSLGGPTPEIIPTDRSPRYG